MASSSSSSSRNWVYDVFPSFSGEDVRRGFLSHFMRELDRRLIIAFKDNETERSHSLDPVLRQAIKDSKIAIVVFSKNYASSTWCLNELLEIVKCKKEFGQIVIPVFYDLEPSHVRKQTEEFGYIFEKTCKNRTKEEVQVVQLWRQALTYVANLLGYHSEKWPNEAKMIEAIASDLLGKLNLTPSNDFEEFVGMEDHIAKMSELLHLQSEEVRMVGIWGPSGIGKTTIARAVYARLCPLFQGCVFIDRAFVSRSKEIYSRGCSDEYSMKLHLQGNFLSKILGENNIKINHLGAVRDRLKHQKVLIFIDDLDDQVLLDALAGQCQWFGSGSRIIVVTNDKRLLVAHAISNIYEVDLPSLECALEMLCRSAFRQNSPPKGFEDLAIIITRYAGSLPLGLNVLGSYMQGKSKEYWNDMLPRLQNGLDGKIEKTLRMSYDGLGSEEDKAIFRHIACLFNYKPLIYIQRLLANSNMSVNIGLENLVDNSLIQVRLGCMVEMHLLLQKMGRNFVRKQAIDEPGKREFLVDWKDIYEVLNENTGTKKVLGISLNVKETDDELHVHENAFKGMSNLRFLTIERWWKNGRLQLPESFDYLPPKLKLLCWDDYPMRCMPSKFCPGNLVELKMENSKLEKLWEGVLSLTCLKHMDLSRSENLREIPDLSEAINLEILELNSCSSLVELPPSIGNLHKLTELSMMRCTNLEILPSGINLKSLNRLILNECSQLRSFPDISTNISLLLLSKTEIEEIPWWIDKFSKLIYLYMNDCSKLKSVFLNITKLKHLEDIDFSNCRALTRADLSGYKSDKRWMEEANIDTKSLVVKEASSSFPSHSPKLLITFKDCFNLDQNALFKKQSHFGHLILQGEEVPLYFTHQITGTSSLTIPLLHTSLLQQQPFRFRTCFLVESKYLTGLRNVTISVKVNWRFKDRQRDQSDSTDQQHSFFTYKGTWLIVSDYNFYPPQPNYDHVDISHDMSCEDTTFILKGWGIRLVGSSLENRPSNQNTLPHVCETNMSNETEQGKECGGSDAEAERRRKRMRNTRRARLNR